MILAAGKGERMRPLTLSTPKPLLGVGGKALIEYHLERLASHGFRDIVINTSWLGEQIQAALGDGTRWGVTINYTLEQPQPLETAGGIVNALQYLGDEPFLVVNGDIWCSYQPDRGLNLADSLAHIVLVDNPEHNPDGDFGLHEGQVINEARNRLTFSGIGYYRPSIFKGIRQGTAAPLAPILRRLADQDKLGGEYYSGEWLDIGTPQRLEDLDASLPG